MATGSPGFGGVGSHHGIGTISSLWDSLVIGSWLVPGYSHLLSLTAFSVYRSGQKVRGRGLIYRYSVASGAPVASLASGGQFTVPEGPELACLGQVGVHNPEAFGQLCV